MTSPAVALADRVVAELATDAPEFFEDALMADVTWLTDEQRRGRGSFQPSSGDVATYIENVFKTAGLEVQRQSISPGIDSVFGIVRGDAKAVLISAHYDHLGVASTGEIFPGADDNASGVAVMLALARYAAKQKTRHTIIFAAFAAEEAGLIGSRTYLDKPIWPLADTIAVINFDMVGRNFLESLLNRTDTVGVVGLEDDDVAREVTTAAARAAGLRIVAAPARTLEVLGVAFRTDEWWFRKNGLRAFHFSTGVHGDYHQPTDTADRLVPSQMAKIAKTAAVLMVHLADG